jgi:c-di-AMP phosphodiesterase-like protein
MALLRPIEQLAAEKRRDEINQEVEDTLNEMAKRIWVFLRKEDERKFVPMREGRSLHTPVARRSYRKGKASGRYPTWSEI